MMSKMSNNRRDTAIRVEDYPDEASFVYRSHRRNILLVRPPKSDAFRLADHKNRVLSPKSQSAKSPS